MPIINQGWKQVKGSCRCFGVAEADFRGTSARRHSLSLTQIAEKPVPLTK